MKILLSFKLFLLNSWHMCSKNIIVCGTQNDSSLPYNRITSKGSVAKTVRKYLGNFGRNNTASKASIVVIKRISENWYSWYKMQNIVLHWLQCNTMHCIVLHKTLLPYVKLMFVNWALQKKETKNFLRILLSMMKRIFIWEDMSTSRIGGYEVKKIYKE